MKRAILATAGHVDHGKTALLKALTGIDCDRWKEEKERGITIDLGFAFMQKDDLQIGFVDVPGHEKFIKNMLAGAGGVDAFLLVVSAEEGIKPQTVEHVEILKILGVTSGLCALTKVDTMDEELSDLVEEEVNDFLQSQFPEPIPIIRTSARDGTGIQHLHDRLIQFVSELSTRSDTSHPSRLPLDRAFILKGIGVVVTGSLVRGTISSGDRLVLLPEGREVRVRSLQVHGKIRDRAVAPERTSANLSGLELENLERGQILVSESYPNTRTILLEGRFYEDVKDNQRVRVHHFTREIFGRLHLRPGISRFQILLESPLPALRGDHIVIRKYSPQTLLGGGTILDTTLPKLHPRRHTMETIASLPQGDVRGWRDLWLTVAGPRGIAQNDWPYISGFANQSYDRDPSPASEVSIGSRNYHGDTLMALQSKLIHTLDRVRKANPLVEGIPISELRTRLHLTNDDLITYLAQAAGFTVERGAVYPEPSSTSCREGADELERLLEYLKSQGTFVEQATLPATLKLSEKECTTLLSLGVKQGSVVRLGGGLCLHREIIDSLVQRLTDQGWTEFSVADVKNVLGLSRKYVIPFLEFLDGSRITVRKGDKRVFVTRKKQIAES